MIFIKTLQMRGRRLSASRTLLYATTITFGVPLNPLGIAQAGESATSNPATNSSATSNPTVPAASDSAVTSSPSSSPATNEAQVNLSRTPPETGRGRLIADSWRYAGDLLIAEAVTGESVRFESNAGNITARKITLNVVKKTVQAEGDVLVERVVQISRGELRPRNLVSRPQRSTESFTESLRGNNFSYDFIAQEGQLDNARLLLSTFDLAAVEILIKGQRYMARNVILRPGGLTEAERKIYGTPPFNLRAARVTIEPRDQPAEDGQTGNQADGRIGQDGRRNLRAIVSGAGLYYKNFRLVPVPSYILQSGLGTSRRNPSAFTITPRISFNSADRLLLTTRFRFAVSNDPGRTALNADVGASSRIGFRGGLSLDSNTRVGTFSLRGRSKDIITTQLTNRIVLNRLPELQYTSRLLPLFNLPRGQQAGVGVLLEGGRYSERTIGAAGNTIRSPRDAVTVGFTTRINRLDGPYLDLFARRSRYSNFGLSYRNTGFEVGYEGTVLPRVRGLISYRSTSIGGLTPFRFDQVEIARELRTTVDLQATPRYIIPIDLRYDLDQKKLRDRTVGVLRSYKTFAYGVVYQTAHRDLRLEVRQAF